ncbi:unnamed protein product [Chironomus riparius]|uniref:EGF-like domain-containing protein n=1 Tax=Chironomus riparius TaxID=315576 RepID=A0A9N9S483_9DIPT|nr:unnamed protein product [Chironomus riparius]
MKLIDYIIIISLSSSFVNLKNLKSLSCSSSLNKTCKYNEFCDPHEKICKIFNACIGDGSCETDEYCDSQKRTCIKGCRDDYSCNEDEYCDRLNDQLCKKGCREWSIKCKHGEFCSSESHQCVKGCKHDTHCESNEVCNLKNNKCYSYCYKSPCGNNSVCTIVDHNRHCSCMTGYSPLTGFGCKLNGQSDSTVNVDSETLDCQKYCGPQSMCAIENNKITCYCSYDIGKNPFIDCSFVLPHPPIPIGPGCIAVLCG